MTPPIAMILAGGLSSRMGGGDKGLLRLGQTTVLAHIIDRLSPQVETLALNANGDLSRFAALTLPVHPDTTPDHPGPLAGILTAMTWAQDRGATHIITAPCDTPFLPCDLVPRLQLAGENHTEGMAIAASDRIHPTCGHWPVSLLEDLTETLANGHRRVTDWTARHQPAIAAFPTSTPDPFFNVNTPDDLAQAESYL